MREAGFLLLLIAGACSATETPTRDELAHALRSYRTVAPIDLTHIACQSFAPDEPTEYACRWRQREDGHWRDWQGYFALSGAGWQTIDTPARRP